jgi:hypothetical protein
MFEGHCGFAGCHDQLREPGLLAHGHQAVYQSFSTAAAP